MTEHLPHRSQRLIIIKRLACGIALFVGLSGRVEAQSPSPAKATLIKALVYSDTGYFRHPDIPKTNRRLMLLGHENGIDVHVTE